MRRRNAATAALHSKGAAFSSLSRRNAMKPEHLHFSGEALLVKSLPVVAGEDVSLTLHL